MGGYLLGLCAVVVSHIASVLLSLTWMTSGLECWYAAVENTLTFKRCAEFRNCG